jgi:hypothetical protein
LFEDFRAPTLTERLRSVTILPLAAFLAVQIGGDLEALIGPSAFFYWLMDSVALIGALGIGLGVRIAIAERRSFDWRAAVWLTICLLLSLGCAHLFAVLTSPYIPLLR